MAMCVRFFPVCGKGHARKRSQMLSRFKLGVVIDSMWPEWEDFQADQVLSPCKSS